MLSFPLPAVRLCLTALLLTGCAHRGIRPPTTAAAPEGQAAVVAVPSPLPATITKTTYTGTFGGAKHTFVLYSNGKFQQQFQPGTGKMITSTGKWKINHPGFGGLTFDHIYLPLDKTGEPQKTGKLQLTNFSGASMTHDGAFIYFTHIDDDEDESNLVGIKLPGF